MKNSTLYIHLCYTYNLILIWPRFSPCGALPTFSQNNVITSSAFSAGTKTIREMIPLNTISTSVKKQWTLVQILHLLDFNCIRVYFYGITLYRLLELYFIWSLESGQSLHCCFVSKIQLKMWMNWTVSHLFKCKKDKTKEKGSQISAPVSSLISFQHTVLASMIFFRSVTKPASVFSSDISAPSDFR